MAEKNKIGEITARVEEKEEEEGRKKYNLLLNGHASQVYRIVSSFPLSPSSPLLQVTTPPPLFVLSLIHLPPRATSQQIRRNPLVFSQ